MKGQHQSGPWSSACSRTHHSPDTLLQAPGCRRGSGGRGMGAGTRMQPGRGREDLAGPRGQVLEVMRATAPPGAAYASQNWGQRHPRATQGSPTPPFPAEVQPHSPSPSSSRTRSAPPSLLGRLSPARSDLSITRSLLSRDRSLGGQKAGGTRLCVRTTRGAGGKAVPEEHGGGGPRGPGRRESAQDSPGADPASVTQAPRPLELAALSPATLRPDRDSPDRGTLTGARSGASARRRRRPQGCS